MEWMTPELLLKIISFVSPIVLAGLWTWWQTKQNKEAIEQNKTDLENEAKERKEADVKINKRIDHKQEKFESCINEMKTRQGETNKLLYLICGHLGIGADGSLPKEKE